MGKSFPMSGSQVLSVEQRSVFKWVIHFASYEALEESKLHGFLSSNPPFTCTVGSPHIRARGEGGQTGVVLPERHSGESHALGRPLSCVFFLPEGSNGDSSPRFCLWRFASSEDLLLPWDTSSYSPNSLSCFIQSNSAFKA